MAKPIGIFDSGMGGLTVLAEAKRILPNESFVYYGDSKNAPYGVKSKDAVIQHSKKITEILIHKYQVKAIIVACNTATSAAIAVLRGLYDIPIIGMEPAIKPALEENNGKKIAVMATEMTLKERKFRKLVGAFNAEDQIIKIPCSELVMSIENGHLNADTILNNIKYCFAGLSLETIESIVLGCTHFLFIKEYLKEFLKDVQIKIYDGNLGTIYHLKNRLLENNMLEDSREQKPTVEIINSGNKLGLSKKLFKYYYEGYFDGECTNIGEKIRPRRIKEN